MNGDNQNTDEQIEIVDNQAGQEVNINDLSDKKFGESVPKPHLDGKVAVISNVKLTTGDIELTKSGKKKRKLPLVLTYKTDDGSEAYESYGGINRFIGADGSEGEPTLYVEGTNTGANLIKAWCNHLNKKVEDVSLKEFLNGLQGARVRLKEIQVNNPFKNEMTHKNVIEVFL